MILFIFVVLIIIVGIIMTIIGWALHNKTIEVIGVISVILVLTFVLVYPKTPQSNLKSLLQPIQEGYYYHLEQDSEIIAYPDSLFTITHK